MATVQDFLGGNLFNIFSNWQASATIKVTPEQLRSKAGSLQSKIVQIQREFDSLEARMNATAAYWEGEAHDTYYEKYQEFRPRTEEIIKRMQEHVTDLNSMAGVYQDTEKAVQNMIDDLPSDLIV